MFFIHRSHRNKCLSVEIGLFLLLNFNPQGIWIEGIRGKGMDWKLIKVSGLISLDGKER